MPAVWSTCNSIGTQSLPLLLRFPSCIISIFLLPFEYNTSTSTIQISRYVNATIRLQPFVYRHYPFIVSPSISGFSDIGSLACPNLWWYRMYVGVVSRHQFQILLKLPPLHVGEFRCSFVPVLLGPLGKASRFLEVGPGPSVPCLHIVHHQSSRELKVGILERGPDGEDSRTYYPKSSLFSCEIANEGKTRCHC